LSESVAVARETARLARSQYVEGAADLQVVLDAQRGALDFAEAAVVARQDRLIAAVDLYRALGGHPSSAQ
jgi:outer membrane protein TolC